MGTNARPFHGSMKYRHISGLFERSTLMGGSKQELNLYKIQFNGMTQVTALIIAAGCESHSYEEPSLVAQPPTNAAQTDCVTRIPSWKQSGAIKCQWVFRYWFGRSCVKTDPAAVSFWAECSQKLVVKRSNVKIIRLILGQVFSLKNSGRIFWIGVWRTSFEISNFRYRFC